MPAYDMPDLRGRTPDRRQQVHVRDGKAYSFPAGTALAADAAAGFPVVDPEPWICTRTTCPAIVGNYLVYRDDTHLTADFQHLAGPDGRAATDHRR